MLIVKHLLTWTENSKNNINRGKFPLSGISMCALNCIASESVRENREDWERKSHVRENRENPSHIFHKTSETLYCTHLTVCSLFPRKASGRNIFFISLFPRSCCCEHISGKRNLVPVALFSVYIFIENFFLLLSHRQLLSLPFEQKFFFLSSLWTWQQKSEKLKR